MTDAATILLGDPHSPFLLIGDHASAYVPPEIDLAIDRALLALHIAVDLGVAELGAAICEALDCPGLLGPVSRLVIDLNREEDAPSLIPLESDGHLIPGNQISADERQARVDRYWRSYHAALAAQIAVQKPRLLISLHSFTPQLSTRPDEARPWEIGILYSEDDRAARIAIPLLEAAGLIVGDQLPYSGKDLNATMNTHGEGHGIAYLGLEVRQDLIADAAGVARWAELLLPVIRACEEALVLPA
jgi:predicted N-formylglutamate amidohydrolase